MLNHSIIQIYEHGNQTRRMQLMNALSKNELVNGDVNNTVAYVY